MPRRARITPGGWVYHTLNRANGRSELFSKPEDYVAFETNPGRADRPSGWVNEVQTDAEVEALRRCVNRGTPYGSANWTNQIAAALGVR
jgi:hypothetical protein